MCNVPTLRLKALNKHTHIMYTEMEKVIPQKQNKNDTDKGSSITKRKMHTHTAQTDRSEGQCGLTKIF